MKRITSTPLVAAIPALSALGVFPGWNSAPQLGQRGGTTGTQSGRQDGAEGAGDTDKEGEDVATPPEGFDPRGRTTFDIFGRRSKVRGNTFEDRIKGGWRLNAMTLGGLTSTGRQAQGFLHIGDSFLSMEIHALWQDNGGRGGAIPSTDVHLTFTSEYRFDPTGKLICSTVIGSYVDETTGELTWERTGFKREYRVREVQNELELTFKNGSSGVSRLVFTPYLPRQGGERDVFGRPVGVNFGGTDIYGRKTANERLERDIFGRPIQPEPGEEPEEDPEEEGDEGSGMRDPANSRTKGSGAGGSPLRDRGGR